MRIFVSGKSSLFWQEGGGVGLENELANFHFPDPPSPRMQHEQEVLCRGLSAQSRAIGRQRIRTLPTSTSRVRSQR